MMMTDVARLRQALDEAPFSPEERREVEQMVADGVGWDDFRHWLEVVQANRLASASKHQRELTAMERFREHHDFLWKRYPHLLARSSRGSRGSMPLPPGIGRRSCGCSTRGARGTTYEAA
jgi:hypothetical protein